MRVELMVSRASLRGPEPVGMVLDVEQAEGERMIAAGHARLVRRARKPEKATRADAAERADV